MFVNAQSYPDVLGVSFNQGAIFVHVLSYILCCHTTDMVPDRFIDRVLVFFLRSAP